MQANSEVMSGEVREFPLAWEETRCWARRLLQRDRVARVAVTAGGLAVFLGLVGVVQYALYQAVQNWSITEVGASVFGFF